MTEQTPTPSTAPSIATAPVCGEHKAEMVLLETGSSTDIWQCAECQERFVEALDRQEADRRWNLKWLEDNPHKAAELLQDAEGCQGACFYGRCGGWGDYAGPCGGCCACCGGCLTQADAQVVLSDPVVRARAEELAQR